MADPARSDYDRWGKYHWGGVPDYEDEGAHDPDNYSHMEEPEVKLEAVDLETLGRDDPEEDDDDDEDCLSVDEDELLQANRLVLT